MHDACDTRIKLFLAEVVHGWCTTFCTDKTHLLQFVITPPPSGFDLQDLLSTAPHTAGLEAESRMAWCVVSEETGARIDILAALAIAGCLMDESDFQEVAARPGADGKKIGGGAFATVYRAVGHRGDPVAVKKMNVDVDFKAIEREALMLLKAKSHCNIVNFQGIFRLREKEAERIALTFDVAPFGDLLHVVLQHGVALETEAKPVAQGVLNALAHLHALGMIHRDIKVENILLKAPHFPLLTDFGLATMADDTEQMARRCGSPGYIAPEMCVGRRYGSKVDVFGMGVVLFFILSKKMPFSNPGDNAMTVLRATVKSAPPFQDAPFPELSSSLRSLLKALLCKDADLRASSQDSLRHAWFEPRTKTLEESEGNFCHSATRRTPHQEAATARPRIYEVSQQVSQAACSSQLSVSNVMPPARPTTPQDWLTVRSGAPDPALAQAALMAAHGSHTSQLAAPALRRLGGGNARGAMRGSKAGDVETADSKMWSRRITPSTGVASAPSDIYNGTSGASSSQPHAGSGNFDSGYGSVWVPSYSSDGLVTANATYSAASCDSGSRRGTSSNFGDRHARTYASSSVGGDGYVTAFESCRSESGSRRGPESSAGGEDAFVGGRQVREELSWRTREGQVGHRQRRRGNKHKSEMSQLTPHEIRERHAETSDGVED